MLTDELLNINFNIYKMPAASLAWEEGVGPIQVPIYQVMLSMRTKFWGRN